MLNEIKMSENKTAQLELEHGSGASQPGGFLAGLLLGSLAGAGRCCCWRPNPGSAPTRAKIQQKGMELRDQTIEAVDDAMAQARATAHQVKADVRKDAKELQHRGQEMLDEQMERLSMA